MFLNLLHTIILATQIPKLTNGSIETNLEMSDRGADVTAKAQLQRIYTKHPVIIERIGQGINSPEIIRASQKVETKSIICRARSMHGAHI